MLNLDTHILLWALEGELSRKERQQLEADSWGISSIVLWEIEKLYQLGRIALDPLDKPFRTMLSSITVWPIDLNVITALRRLDFRGDPADELIAATSIAVQAPLITRDRRILASKVVPMV